MRIAVPDAEGVAPRVNSSSRSSAVRSPAASATTASAPDSSSRLVRPGRHRDAAHPSARAHAMSRGVSPITIVSLARDAACRRFPPAGARSPAARRGPRRRSRTRPALREEPPEPGARELQPRDRLVVAGHQAERHLGAVPTANRAARGLPAARCATDPSVHEPRVLAAARVADRLGAVVDPLRRHPGVEQHRPGDLGVGAARRGRAAWRVVARHRRRAPPAAPRAARRGVRRSRRERASRRCRTAASTPPPRSALERRCPASAACANAAISRAAASMSPSETISTGECM